MTQHTKPPESSPAAPGSRPPRRIFVSYAREDEVWARDRAQVLRSAGHEVFLDVDRLQPGQTWPSRLIEELRRSDQVRLGWSRYAAQSEWVRREYTKALALREARKDDQFLIIETLDDTALPPELQHIQTSTSALAAGDEDKLLRNPSRELPSGSVPPSFLLRPEYAVVPFRGREEILDDLKNWCASDRPFDLRLYVAEGGMGKTRLFVELCLVLGREGWDARFLDHERLREEFRSRPATLDRLFRPRLRRLMALDYAESRREELGALLRRAESKVRSTQVRLILLARNAGDWWTELQRSSPAAQILLEGVHPIKLPPLAGSANERLDAYSAAVEAFRPKLGDPQSPPASPDLTAPEFERTLFIHMAALAGLQGIPFEKPGDLIERLLDREVNYLHSVAEDRKLDPALRPALAPALAFVTLAGGCRTAGDAAGLLARCPDFVGASRPALQEVSRTLRQVFAGGEGTGPLEPDLLGEALVARETERDFRLLHSYFAGSTPDEARHGLMVLDRIAARRPEREAWLSQVLARDLTRLAHPAMEVAMTSGDPIGRILAECFARHPQPGLSAELVWTVPARTVALRELGAVLTRQALDSPPPPGKEAGEWRALLLNNLGTRLRDLGRREEALPVYEKAVRIFLPFFKQHPSAFERRIRITVGNYRRLATEMRLHPDPGLLRALAAAVGGPSASDVESVERPKEE